METVQQVLDANEVRGYTGNLATDMLVQFEGDVVGYAVKVQGYYTRGELLAIAEDLKAFNESTPK
jgi:hypothetical protein